MGGLRLLDLRWEPREPPLAPEAVLGEGPVALALARRLLDLPAEPLALLTVAATPADAGTSAEPGVVPPLLLAVLGPEEALPWVDGVHYYGRTEEAPSLLQPTNRRAPVPESLLEEAVQRRAQACPAPVALLPAARRLVSLNAARRCEPTRLAAWLGAQPGTRRAAERRP